MQHHTWTYGAEHELADWSWDDLPKLTALGFTQDKKDNTIVNSNGIANDPKGKLYRFGGELCTPPTTTIVGQLCCLRDIKEQLTSPAPVVNYRSNLHIHIRIPGLKDDLEALKKVQDRIHKWMPHLLNIIHPIPSPEASFGSLSGDYDYQAVLKGAKRRNRRRKVSHHTLLTENRLLKQRSAATTTEFFEREVPLSTLGKVMWHAQARCCVNLRQLLQTDTVEFRHFAGTLDEGELEAAIHWCDSFIHHALIIDQDPVSEKKALDNLRDLAVFYAPRLPKFAPYDYELEENGYRLTCHDGTLSKDTIAKNIAKLLG